MSPNNSIMDNVANVANEGLDTLTDTMSNVGAEIKEKVKENLDAILSTPSSAITMDNLNTASNSMVESVPSSYAIDDTNKWGWITLYIVTIVIAILGNLLFIISSLCTKRTRTTGYYLLINLSIRDILVACLCVPFTLYSEITNLDWWFGDAYCICYRFFYYCFLFFLPLTLLFLSYHLFVENCKWNFAGEEGVVPRPWPHTIYIPLIWFFSAAFAVPTAFWSQVRPWKDDIYRNDNFDWRVESESQVCMHTSASTWETGSDYFYIASTLVTFCLPVILLFIPWWALLVQICGCCTRKLRSSEFWLSLMTLFMILFYEASRAPFELFNFHHILTNLKLGQTLPIPEFLPLAESYKAVMKWAVYAPALLHPLLYFTFSPEARHGCYILFSRCCSCCCSKAGPDVEMASDDEKGQMLHAQQHNEDQVMDDGNVPLQSKEEGEM